jgi:hypothetical protein
MKVQILACLTGLALAAAVAYGAFGVDGGTDPVGVGVLVGGALGLGIGAVGAWWQGVLLARGSRHALHAFVVAFLVKLVVVCAGTLFLRYAGPAWIDWRAYLVSFPVGVVWITAFGVLASARTLRHRTV